MEMLENKVVVLTGAGSNVGRAATGLFLEEGAQLMLADRDPERILIPDGGAEKCLTVTADLTNADECEALVAAALDRFGCIDCLANTFGIDPPEAKDTLNTSETDWDKIININLKAVFLCCRAVLPAMRQNGGGSIVNIGSQGSLSVLPGMTAYGVSKAGVLQLTRQIAADHGVDKIRANCVCPSGLEMPSADRLAILDNTQLARRSDTMKTMSPLGRVCSPLDVANAMLFLLSDLSGFITAAALPVEGGATTILRF
jgi:NAD(P)-dependent dehydrogenase (short-subunit alcohol dehydrogenase family)